MQASGAEIDMVMSTSEQETFETAFSVENGFDPIRAGLTRVDVRQVLTLPSGCASHQPPLRALSRSSPIGRQSAATSRTRTKS